MKKIIFAIFLLSAMVLMMSCNSQKFVVNGEPGTIITTLDGNTTLAVIDQSGKAEIITKRKDGYSPFLQAKAPNSDQLVPFALDYKDKNRTVQNAVIGSLLVYPMGFLGPTWVLWSRIGTDYDYNYLDYQRTNNDLIK